MADRNPDLWYEVQVQESTAEWYCVARYNDFLHDDAEDKGRKTLDSYAIAYPDRAYRLVKTEEIF